MNGHWVSSLCYFDMRRIDFVQNVVRKVANPVLLCQLSRLEMRFEVGVGFDRVLKVFRNITRSYGLASRDERLAIFPRFTSHLDPLRIVVSKQCVEALGLQSMFDFEGQTHR